jgi:hypothetical protein
MKHLEQELENDAELLELRNVLHAQRSKPTEIQQRWAWTRLEAHLQTPPAEKNFFPFRSLGWVLVGCLVISFGISWQLSQTSGPLISYYDSTLSAVSFRSSQTSANVIWVDGYDAFP